jgi:serine/threonine-protein kinase HipA
VGALLGRTAEHKYEGSLEQVAQAVREFAAPKYKVDSLRRLFLLCVANNALRNGDAHLKNYGLLYDTPADARLSPVYDVLTTRCFEKLRNDAPALTLEGRQQWDDYAALGRFGQAECLVSRADTRKAMEVVLRAMQHVLPRLAEARDAYPYAASTLWVMRAEWLESIEILERALKA